MQPLTILIVGATGQQGTATISALHTIASSQKQHGNKTPLFQILALTRSASSPKATALKAKFPDITLVEGSTRNPDAIFTAHPDITSIFLVTVPGAPGDEEAQALPLIDAAIITHKIPHLVFSSVDRGGDDASWENETDVPHFASKHRIEMHLRSVTATATASATTAGSGSSKTTKTAWTILRPTGFMDNYGSPTPFGRMMAALWATMPSGRRMQLVSVHDIGVFAARALLDPEGWQGRAVGLAGDEITFEEAREAYRETLGREMPQAWALVGQGVRWAVGEAGTSMRWFEDVGFGADIKALREEEPDLLDFRGWLKMTYGRGNG